LHDLQKAESELAAATAEEEKASRRKNMARSAVDNTQKEIDAAIEAMHKGAPQLTEWWNQHREQRPRDRGHSA
jgi:hypothetical protein